MRLPDLTQLSLASRPLDVAQEWREACGTRPDWQPWDDLDGADKQALLHTLAEDCSDPSDPETAYVTVYDGVGIERVLARRQWSVEHVVPQLHVNGREPGDAENDPLGWVEATRTANSRRSNLPLVLWPGLYVRERVAIDGVPHFVPPEEQRARLARKWAFVRASYPDEVAPPSEAQRKYAAKICANMKHTQPFESERCVNQRFRDEYGYGNPLLERDATTWLGSPAFRALVFASARNLRLVPHV